MAAFLITLQGQTQRENYFERFPFAFLYCGMHAIVAIRYSTRMKGFVLRIKP
jgi:hypothetical protein